jgi:hypothetical protein
MFRLIREMVITVRSFISFSGASITNFSDSLSSAADLDRSRTPGHGSSKQLHGVVVLSSFGIVKKDAESMAAPAM